MFNPGGKAGVKDYYIKFRDRIENVIVTVIVVIMGVSGRVVSVKVICWNIIIINLNMFLRREDRKQIEEKRNV